MILKRKLYQKLLQWKETSQGKTAVMLDGARRVGKSFLCRQFAENEYRSYILIDFSNIPGDIRDLFENETADFDLFFAKLSAFYGTILYPRESVIIFDEVQQYPRARQLMKHLVADGRYDYMETGSLISLKKNVQDIVIPSEERHLELFPLDFEEFLWAMGDEASVSLLKLCFDQRKPLGQALHRKVMNDFRQYMLVGGMPQSVLAYVPSKDFAAADQAKKDILTLYRNDVTKFAEGYESKVLSVFDEIPAQLSRKEKKFKLSSINKNARFAAYEDSFIWLKEAMIVNPCFNTTDPNVGLTLNRDSMSQKCYMADTGLLVTHTFMDNDYLDNEFYRAVLFDKMNINEGMLMENIVAQTFRSSGHKLFFYSRSDAAHRENHMEIDFLLSKGKKICPVEVKSDRYQRHASLDKFRAKFSARLGESYILYTKDVMVKDNIVHLPIYMAMFL